MAVIQYRRYVSALPPTEQQKAFRIDIMRKEKVFLPGETIEGKLIFLWIHRYPKLLGVMVKLQCCGEIHFGKKLLDSILQHTYYSKKYYVCGDGVREFHVPCTLKSYPFMFTLPNTGLPQSFMGIHGSIKYTIEAIAKMKESPFTVGTTEEFTMRGYLDLNSSLPREIVAGPIILEFDNSFQFPLLGFFRAHANTQQSKGNVQVKLNLDKRGFAFGEFIQFQVKVTNGSKKELAENFLKFLQVVKYKTQNISKVITLGCSQGPVITSNTCGSWTGAFEVPFDILISSPSNIPSCIEISYKLKVEIVTGPMSRNIKYDYPIIIGTIPFENIPRRSRSMEFDMSQNISHTDGESRHSTLASQPSIECPNYLDLAAANGDLQLQLRPSGGPPPSYDEAIRNYNLN